MGSLPEFFLALGLVAVGLMLGILLVSSVEDLKQLSPALRVAATGVTCAAFFFASIGALALALRLFGRDHEHGDD